MTTTNMTVGYSEDCGKWAVIARGQVSLARELETVGYINYYSPTERLSAEPYSTTGYECDALEAFTSAVGRGLCASLRITEETRWAIAKAEGAPLVETILHMLLELDREARRLQRHADEVWSAATFLD